MSETVFEVGSTYENEKGGYEVLSMDTGKNKMVIKWENGEEVSTAIDLQKRIIARIEYEREAAEAAKHPKSRKAASSRGAKFDGFKETDFSGGIAGTTWRTQKALGGAVTKQLNPDGLEINSWAVPRMPEIHWMDAKRRRKDDDSLQAKLFARLNKESLYYGFYVERSDPTPEAKNDWNGFVEWLSDGGNESWLKEIVEEYDLRISDRKDVKSPFHGTIELGDGNWRLANGGEAKEVQSLAGFLKELPDTARVDLQITKITGKDDTMARGKEIAGDISGLFDILMPLYKAAK